MLRQVRDILTIIGFVVLCMAAIFATDTVIELARLGLDSTVISLGITLLATGMVIRIISASKSGPHKPRFTILDALFFPTLLFGLGLYLVP